MEELRGGLGVLKKALARGKPAYDIDEMAAERMAMHDAIVPEQKNIDRAAACDTSEEPRETEGLRLSWSLISLLLSHLPVTNVSKSSTKGWRSQSEIMSLSRWA